VAPPKILPKVSLDFQLDAFPATRNGAQIDETSRVEPSISEKGGDTINVPMTGMVIGASIPRFNVVVHIPATASPTAVPAKAAYLFQPSIPQKDLGCIIGVKTLL